MKVVYVGLLVVMAAGFCAARGEAATENVDRLLTDIQIGWNGHLVLGSWTTASAAITIPEAGTYRLDVTATDPDGNLATYKGDEVSRQAGPHRISGRFQLGRADGQIRLTVYHNGKLWKEDRTRARHDTPVFSAHRCSERLLITVGLPSDMQQHFPPPEPGQRMIVHLSDPAALPTDTMSYDGVSALLLAGKHKLDDAQTEALVQWVRRGGRLMLSLGTTPAEFRETLLAQRLPITIAAEPIATRELTALESYAGKTVRIVPPGQRVMIPKLSFSFGRSLAGNRTDPVLIQVPLSFGNVTFLGMDLTQAPLKEWPGAGDLLRKMTDTSVASQKSTGRSQQLGSTGITDMASQIAAALESFEPVLRTSPWWVLGGLFVVLSLIGPLDYWLVDRLWKRPLATWISFPVMLSCCACAAVWAAGRSNGHQVLVNQLAVVDLDADTDFIRARHWTALYSPDARSYQLDFQPSWPAWSPKQDAAVEMTAGWTGLPESAFGGMYRSGATGLQFGAATYDVAVSEGRFKEVPSAQWSTVAVSVQSHGTQPGLVDANLISTATGRLSGTVLHRLPGPLTDWFLAYENRIYRQLEKDGGDAVVPLPSQQTWRVDQRSVTQRELRAHLTRTTARTVERGKSLATSGQIVLQQASYDPLSRSFAAILPLWSFHGEIEGVAYTGLRNDALEELDLSPLLDLDRAVLIGFLEEPASEMTVSGDAAPRGRRTTFVRMALPVDRSKQTMRELPKFEKK